jgi:hypothetical protein
MVAVTVEGFTDYAPSPRAVLTIEGLGESQSLVSVWRISDGGRASVQGARRIPLTDAALVTDYAVPFGRPVSYEVEVISGGLGASRTTSVPVTVDAAEGCISDPLMPQSAVAIAEPGAAAGRPVFASAAMASVERKSDVSTFRIMGSSEPFALYGQRASASAIDLSLITDDASEGRKLRDLFDSTASLLVRLPASWQEALPGVCFVAVGSVAENPIEHGAEGALTVWKFAGDTVSPPTIKPLTGGVTFGDVAMLYATFQAKHDSVLAAASAAGESPTFLFDLKHPLG